MVTHQSNNQVGNVNIQNEIGNLMKRLLDAVKQCQARFGGKSELATESDSRVSVLCSAWEAVLQHGMIHSNKTLSTIKQVTEITGLSKIGTGISSLETEPVFWHYVRAHLSRHETDRYTRLSRVTTDAGRGRAWLRSALNEHSLEKYMHMMVEDDRAISQFYEPWAFLRDQEKRNTLPNMARGLDSILFAISIDQEELNSIRSAKGLEELISPSHGGGGGGGSVESVLPSKWEDHMPVIGGDDSAGARKDHKKKKKKVPKIVSFDDVDRDSSSSPSSSVSSPKAIPGRLPDYQPESPHSKSLPAASGVTFGRGSLSENLLLHGEATKQPKMVRNEASLDRDGTGISSTELHGISSTVKDRELVDKGIEHGSTGNEKEQIDQPKQQDTQVQDSPQQKASVFRKMFSFGSSSLSGSNTELQRTSSRTSLDSVQSSKSELGTQDRQQQQQSPQKKGHRKSHSDTSMFSTNIGSRIFKTVVEETKRRFAFSESEGGSSLQSSRASSTKSLNEETTDENCETRTKVSLGQQHEPDNITAPVVGNFALNTQVESPVSTACSSGVNVSSDSSNVAAIRESDITKTSQPVPTSSVQIIPGVQTGQAVSAGSSWGGPASSQRVGQQAYQPDRPGTVVSSSQSGLTSAQLTGKNSNTNLSSYENSSIYNGDPGSDLTPLSPDGLFISGSGFHPSSRDSPISQDASSVDSSELQSYTEATQQATLALALAQKGVNSELVLRTQGDGSNFPDGVLTSGQAADGMTSRELKEAIVAMMMRKDEVEEQNKHLRFALEAELEVSTALRLEIEEMKKAHHHRQEREAERIRDVSRENDLLKHQLKKYVSAVQLLRRKGADSSEFPGLHIEEDVPAAIPPTPEKRDYSHEAEEYEKKLIQVAEMHGELMEFNENLHRQILAKEKLIKSLQQELTDLRGPLPADMPEPDDDMSLISDIDGGYVNRPLINIWIPSAFLRGKPSEGYHVYQVYVRIRDEEWNIYRRYNEFLDMHTTFKKTHPILATFEFPPKKALGNKGSKFVEMRRKKLQVYLRKFINYLSQAIPEFTSGISREKLMYFIPFFQDQVASKSGNRRQSSGASPSQNAPARQRTGSQLHYSGL